MGIKTIPAGISAAKKSCLYIYLLIGRRLRRQRSIEATAVRYAGHEAGHIPPECQFRA